MKISRKHPVTQKINVLDLPITQEDYKAYINGALAQKAFPNLTSDQREFLISGLLPGEFDAMFSEETDKGQESNVAD